MNWLFIILLYFSIGFLVAFFKQNSFRGNLIIAIEEANKELKKLGIDYQLSITDRFFQIFELKCIILDIFFWPFHLIKRLFSR